MKAVFMSPRATSAQIVSLLLIAVSIIAAGTVLLLYFDREDGINPYVDEAFPWCFKPDAIFIETEADVDGCVLRAMVEEDGKPKPRIERLRSKYKNDLAELSPEEREEAVRERRSNYLRWIDRHIR